jgi:hypothetical protein
VVIAGFGSLRHILIEHQSSFNSRLAVIPFLVELFYVCGM